MDPIDDHQRLAIQQACRDLVCRAAACADAHQPAQLAGLFSDDAVLVRPNAQPLQGRDAIRQAYEQRSAERITRHLVTNTLVEVESASKARAMSYVLLWAGSHSDPGGAQGRPAQGRQVVGEFDDRFTLTPQGWRIAHREARFVLHSGD
jgi:uncharacterized protein (TIGR02246 family)